MNEFEFEIQCYIQVKIEASNENGARSIVCNKFHRGEYDDELKRNPYISEGVRVCREKENLSTSVEMLQDTEELKQKSMSEKETKSDRGGGADI